MQIDSDLRDELAKLAARDFGGVPLGEAVNRLVKEHKIKRVMRRYAELPNDPEEWARYQADVAAWDVTTGDGLPRRTPLHASGSARVAP